MGRNTVPALAVAGLTPMSWAMAAPEEPLPPPEPAPIEASMPRLGHDFEAGEDVSFDQPREDVFGMGQDVEVLAPINDNAFLMGQDVEVKAPIGGDLFAMGQSVTIDHPIGGDVFAMGADILLGPGGSVGGDLYGMAGEVQLKGPVSGSVHVGSGRLELGSTIGGDVEAEVGEITIRDGAHVDGHLDYTSPRSNDDVERIADGGVTFTEDVDIEEDIEIHLDLEEPEPSILESTIAWAGWRVWDYLSKLVVGIVMIALAGAGMARISRNVTERPAESLGYGFLTFIALPVASMICFVTIIGIPLGVVGLFATGMLMFLGQLVTAMWIGEAFLRAARPEWDTTPYLALAVGLVPVVVAFGTPWISFLAILTSAFVGMGAIVMAVARRGTAGA